MRNNVSGFQSIKYLNAVHNKQHSPKPKKPLTKAEYQRRI